MIVPGIIIVKSNSENKTFLPLNLSFANAYALIADINKPIMVGGKKIISVFIKPRSITGISLSLTPETYVKTSLYPSNVHFSGKKWNSGSLASFRVLNDVIMTIENGASIHSANMTSAV